MPCWSGASALRASSSLSKDRCTSISSSARWRSSGGWRSRAHSPREQATKPKPPRRPGARIHHDRAVAPQEPAVLVTIPISHYCEKARWALDRAGVPYRERRHLQGLHRVAVRRAGGGLTAPVLVDDGRVLAESALILSLIHIS